MTSLDRLLAVCSLVTLLTTALHFRVARLFRGNRRGTTIAIRVITATYVSAFVLVACIISLLVVFIHRLFDDPGRAGSQNELLLLTIAGSALVYSGLIGCNKRRRNVAVKLASIPCFGNGSHAVNHQLLAVEKSPLLCFAPQFIAPDSPQQHHVTLSTITSERSQQRPSHVGEPRKSSTLGITKRKVWEFSCRSASPKVYGRAKRQAWPLNVVRTLRTKGKRFVLIKDETVQDGAGAVLLDPDFIQSRLFDKQLIARVVFQAVHRSAFCVLRSWHMKFDGTLLERFAQLPSVICMLNSELRQHIGDEESAEHERCYVTELLWAVIMVEVLDYLQFKRTNLPMLTWLANLPRWLCEYDASKVDREVNVLFERWKAGRSCGTSYSRPCDSECCCHSSFSQTGCGCQCPCVCACP